MTPDIFNSLFEVTAAIMVGLNIRRIIIDKGRAGVSLVAVFFCFGWAVWSLIFFARLDLWYSFAGGIIFAFAYAVWLTLLLYYGRVKRAA